MHSSESKEPVITEAQSDVLTTLSNLNLDDFSLRDAFALIERLQRQLEDERMAEPNRIQQLDDLTIDISPQVRLLSVQHKSSKNCSKMLLMQNQPQYT